LADPLQLSQDPLQGMTDVFHFPLGIANHRRGTAAGILATPLPVTIAFPISSSFLVTTTVAVPLAGFAFGTKGWFTFRLGVVGACWF
jgi:hypothetical protein